MGRLFGTDGIRGIANTELTAQTAYKLGLAVVKVLSGGKNGRVKILIGKDTRASGDMFECALAAGILSAGADAVSLGVVPTPAVAYLVNTTDADAGVMISASHNPAEYNGLKVFAATGMKLPDEIEALMEDVISGKAEAPCADACETGTYTFDGGLVEKYERHVAGILDMKRPMKVLFDCANGASSGCAPKIFASLESGADYVNCAPDGKNINDGCGSTHIEALAETVREGGYDVAFAFDGDADRCLCLDENGALCDGDAIISVLAADMKAKGELPNDTAVVTILSNMGVEAAAKESGIKVVRTSVGDRYVLEEMLRGGYAVGGEQSGHVILTHYAMTGDGEVTAASVLNVISASGRKASEVFSVMKKYPQVSGVVDATTAQKKHFAETGAAKDITAKISLRLGDAGRIVVRPSGTEPYIRVMIEGKDEKLINELLSEAKELVKRAAQL